METDSKRWKFAVLLLFAVTAFLICAFFMRAHNQLQVSSQKVMSSYNETRNFAMREKKTASFYFIDTLPASVHANYRHGTGWVDLRKTEKLWGTRLKSRIHINFNSDGAIAGFFSDDSGEQSVTPSTSIPPAVLFNRAGEEIVFLFDKTGTITMKPKGRS